MATVTCNIVRQAEVTECRSHGIDSQLMCFGNDLTDLKLRPHSDQKGRHILHSRRVAMHAAQICVFATTSAKNPGQRSLNDDFADSRMILKIALG